MSYEDMYLDVVDSYRHAPEGNEDFFDTIQKQAYATVIL